jgi:hypothetical protein
MRYRPASVVLLCAMAVTTSAFAADPLCDYLRAFVRAPLDLAPNGNPGRRWVEVHWLGAWLDLDKGWHVECRSSGAAASKALCAWLPQNVSFEFSNTTPFEVMECYGYKFPHPYPQWFPILMETALWDKAEDDRFIELKADFRDRKSPEAALRISVVPLGPNQESNKPGPLIADNPTTGE